MPKDSKKVRDWPQVIVRLDPEEKEDFQAALKRNNDQQSQAIRKLLRNYSKDHKSDST